MAEYTATEDDNGVVTLYRDGRMTHMMNRRDWDTMRKEFGLPPMDPERVRGTDGPVYRLTTERHGEEP